MDISMPNITTPSALSCRRCAQNIHDRRLPPDDRNPDTSTFAEAGADWISAVGAHISIVRSWTYVRGGTGIDRSILQRRLDLSCHLRPNSCDFIRLMSVSPGFGGHRLFSSFIPMAFSVSTRFTDWTCGNRGGRRCKIDNAAIYRAGQYLVSGSGLLLVI